ncbi:FAS-associated factor 1-like isoform X2 [Acanthaster planci]|uniref:FAS-associated factor 1-like isoform X2 n=1 Tax=Acanthaster planci TaxID=133434 RepID=A0A8B7ZA33_ACAPL|nr:FAS-associated factor 1-like isoform X2 [Acanthaster planci]
MWTRPGFEPGPPRWKACTGIENFEESLAHLEQNEWDLQRAVVSVMGAQDNVSVPDSAPEEAPAAPSMPSVVQFSGVSPCASVPRAFDPRRPRSPPPNRVRLLEFTVSYNDLNTELVVEDNRTVRTVKELLSAQLNLSPEKMLIGGWAHAKQAPEDSDVLSSLQLPLKNSLYVLTPSLPTTSSEQPNGEETSFSDKLTRSFELIINDTDVNQEYRLKYQGCKTILSVKQGMSALTSVEVRHQQWHGWPDDSDNSLTLAASGIDFPNHKLTFSRLPNHSKTDQSSKSGDPINISDSEDETQDMDIDDCTIFTNEYETRKFEPLLPADIENETDGLIQFTHEFSSRYGETHPQFYMGPLEDAVKEAFGGLAVERKLLAIYIHTDKSVQSNVFCSQLLCAESIVNFLTQNFVTWAWDITADENKDRLLSTCTKMFGSVTAATVRGLNQDKFPLLLIVMRIRSNTEVLSILQGNTGLDEMMTSLIHAVDVFTEQRQSEIEQENDRRAAEQLKQEQDAAYHASLMADRAKEQERLKQEREEQRLRELEEQEIREREAEQKALLESLEQQLPDEPAENCPKPTTTLRMRMPGGDVLTRRFLAEQPIRTVMVYLGTKGYHSEDFKVLTTFPKKDLTSQDTSQSFKELGLCPQETLFIEER